MFFKTVKCTTKFLQTGMALGSSNGSSMPCCHGCNSPLLWVDFQHLVICVETDHVLVCVPELSAYFLHQLSLVLNLICFWHNVKLIPTVGRDESVQQYLADLDNMHKVRGQGNESLYCGCRLCWRFLEKKS